MFDQVSYGTCLKFVIDGQQIMGLAYEKMKEAKSSIWIANYDLDPDICLVRKAENQQYGVHSLYQSERSIAKDKNENKNKERGYISDITGDSSDDSTKNDYTLQSLLIEKAREKVDIKIILWEPRLLVRKLPVSKRRGIEGREKKAKFLNQLAKNYGVENYLSVRLDSKTPTLTSGFHEKIIIIDNETAFCGGQDLSNGKWDTTSHSFDSISRDYGSQPWHDVNVMVKGPIVWDVIFHFNQRWVHSILKDDKSVNELVKPDLIGAYLLPHSFSRPSTNIDNKDEERIEIVALRTWKQSFNDKGNDTYMDRNNSIEHRNGIREWYDAMLRKAKHAIYLEDQFPFQDKIITRILIKRLREEPALKVITIGPMEPNLPGFIFGKISHESINDINSNLAALRRAGDGERVRNYSLISQDPKANNKRKQIYVHSKIMIVDDKWITVGSANTDRDGFEASTEFDLGINSSKLAIQLRVKLLTEHIGIRQHDSLESLDTNLDNFNEGFELLEKVAQDNGRRVQRGEFIKGHIYYYNFQEMKFPPPYLGAKGGNKFRLL
jgi:phosphatidylserine/phosphatidylglycerophosphate/cardiolipin synthase-like enzyme